MTIFKMICRNFAVSVLMATFLASCKSEPPITLEAGVVDVKLEDRFWSPRFEQWKTTTVNDVFDKFEGKYDPKTSATLVADFEKMSATWSTTGTQRLTTLRLTQRLRWKSIRCSFTGWS